MCYVANTPQQDNSAVEHVSMIDGSMARSESDAQCMKTCRRKQLQQQLLRANAALPRSPAVADCEGVCCWQCSNVCNEGVQEAMRG
jgi:hypothetical protein